MAMSYEEREKSRKIRMGFGIVASILAFAGIASQSNKEAPTPAVVSSMTATAQGQVTDVAGNVGHRTYKVAYTDSKRDRHEVAATSNGTDEYSRGDFVEVAYDPANPDGGCKIKRVLYGVSGLVSQAEGSSSSGTGSGSGSSGGSASSGPTIAQRWLDEGGSDDPLSDITRIGRNR